MLQKLEVSVHAHWNDNPPVYRLYVNEEMFTERTFGHTPYQFYLIEHIFCNLVTGVHSLILENLDDNAKFKLEDLKVNGVEVNTNLMKIEENNSIRWRFIVDELLNHRQSQLS
jgi:hypothetical protein